MRARIILAVIPAALFAVVFAVRSQPAKVTEPKKPSYTAQVYGTEQVYGSDNFDRRFGPIPDPAIRRVRTSTIIPMRIVADAAQPIATVAPVPEVSVATPPAPVRRARTIRKASLDLCGRHHMRKVYTHGGRSWRCRR